MIYFDDEYHADMVKDYPHLPTFCTSSEVAELAWIVNDYLRGSPSGKTWNTMIKVQKALSLIAFTHIDPTVLYITDMDHRSVLFIYRQDKTGYYLYFSPPSVEEFLSVFSSVQSYGETRQKMIDFLSSL